MKSLPRIVVVVATLCACAPSLRYQAPTSLHSYLLVLPLRDSLSDALALALQRHGVKVARRVRGGNRPAAALIHFKFREQGPGGASWLLVRVADTRSGVIVREASLRLDSLSESGVGRVEAILDSLGYIPYPAS